MAKIIANEQQLTTLKEFRLTIRKIDLDLITLARNLTTLYQYINQRIILTPLKPVKISDESLFAYRDWDSQSMSDTFSRLSQYVLTLEDDWPTSSRTRFAVCCARGGLAANVKDFGKFSGELRVAIEAWEILRKEFKSIAKNDEEFMVELGKLGDYVNEIGESFIRIREVIYTDKPQANSLE